MAQAITYRGRARNLHKIDVRDLDQPIVITDFEQNGEGGHDPKALVSGARLSESVRVAAEFRVGVI